MKILLSFLFAVACFTTQAQDFEQLVLTSKNTVVMRDKFSASSVARVQGQLLELSSKLDQDDEITLVLDSPGGSVIAGMTLIDTVKALPQKVNTLTIFAASMAYQTVQNLGTRYILPSGILMSHRAYLSGVGGQLNGELETRIAFYKDLIDSIDVFTAKRVGLSFKDYQTLIINEYWAGSAKAIKDKHADKIVVAKCSQSLMATYNETVRTFFGRFTLKYSKCPLIRGPIGFVRGNYDAYEKHQLQYRLDRKLPVSVQ